MLILSRYVGEKIRINDDIIIMINGVQGGQVKIGIEAPKNIPVHREEVYLDIQQEKDRPAT